ncbi:MAG TPA: hypothetical protein VHF69_13720, partial [Candidatus Synoicihabitans sp.]|nr:hypothetical protein [Candidatus Synoicihabitans sp.]
GGEGLLQAGDWQVTAAHRWLYSDRHFRGRVEEKHRQEQDTQVINNSHFLDVTATYAISPRLWVNFTLPFTDHDRSSLYEHLGNASGQRFHTQAGGLGDVRLSGTWWVLDPTAHHRGNFSIGIGIKAPTGDYKATDTFIRPAGPTERYVDSSIQPGDGGWGATLEAQGFIHLVGHLSGYANAFYLFNPRERIRETNFSVPDAYMCRLGGDLRIPAVAGLSVSLGGRIEGVPSRDVFGGSRGSRRPGYAISVEPGISYARGRFFGTITVPIAVERNRVRTYGATTTGDAAFADYTINTSLSVRF